MGNVSFQKENAGSVTGALGNVVAGIQTANSHFLRTAGPHFPDSPGHIKRTAWDISRAEGSPPY